MARMTQCHGIAGAARDANRLDRWLLRQVRKPGSIADQRRLVLGKADIHLVIAGDRTDRDSKRPLQRIKRSGLLLSGMAICVATHEAGLQWLGYSSRRDTQNVCQALAGTSVHHGRVERLD